MSKFMDVYEWSLFGSTEIDYSKTDVAFKDIYTQIRKSLSSINKYNKGIVYHDKKHDSDVGKILAHKWNDSSDTEIELVTFYLNKYDSKLNKQAMEGYSTNDKIGRLVNDILACFKQTAIKLGDKITVKYPFLYKMGFDMNPDDGVSLAIYLTIRFDPDKIGGETDE